MIKVFRGAGVVTPSKPPPPTNNFCLYPPPILRCFWKDPLMTPHHPPPHLKHLSLLPPPHPPPLPPPKNFNHTPVAFFHSLRKDSILTLFFDPLRNFFHCLIFVSSNQVLKLHSFSSISVISLGIFYGFIYINI